LNSLKAGGLKVIKPLKAKYQLIVVIEKIDGG
jgi:hypothetical protein